MNYLEELVQELYDNDIQFLEADLQRFDAITIKVDDATGIYLNSEKDFSTLQKEYLLGHEIAHINTSSLYDFNSSKRKVRNREYKAMNEQVLSCDRLNPDSIKEDLEKGLTNYEIAEKYGVCEEFIKDAIEVYSRKFWNK